MQFERNNVVWLLLLVQLIIYLFIYFSPSNLPDDGLGFSLRFSVNSTH